MGKTNYIAAIELSSSRISGAVGVETIDGIRILSTASTPVDGSITKGIVRNVDEVSKAITTIINTLEHNLSDKYKVSIRKAYTSLAGLTMHSLRSRVTRGYDEYTKITPEIINDMARENDDMFQVPEGYKRVIAINQEYRIDGKVDNNPIGAPAKIIEGNYLNLVIKEQYLKQLNESFDMADVKIEDSFSAARMDADILLEKDVRRDGCALVNIGSETTTISIYNKDILRMLKVLPLGSNNITKDLCSEHLSFDEAEGYKITKGYKPQTSDANCRIDINLANSIIYARVSEIIQNVKYQIEESGEQIHHIVFTGGGSKLKNLELLLDEFLPNFETGIISEPNFTLLSDSGVNINGVFTTALYGLLRQGKENCCEEDTPISIPAATQPQTTLFPDDEIETIANQTPKENAEDAAERKRREKEEREKQKEEKRKRKEEEKRRKEEERRRREAERQKNQNGISRWLKEWFGEAMGDDENDNQ